MAASLTDDDILNLAAYYASQSTTPAATPPPDSAAASALYRDGDPARALPSCASCHGPDGRGDGATVTPALRAQQSAYTRVQLEAYARRSRYRSAVPSGLERTGVEAMYDISARLSTDEVQQLALYLQSMR